jgi:hypothetical protein
MIERFALPPANDSARLLEIARDQTKKKSGGVTRRIGVAF